MDDSQAQKKNKKVKKRSESNSGTTTTSNCTKSAGENACNTSSKNSLSKGLNIKTPENIKVTMVKTEETTEVVSEEGSNKKKKKSKKKSKEEVKDTIVENTTGNDSNSSLLNFSENGIHLVNHPEISVTFMNTAQASITEAENIKEVSPSGEEKQDDNVSSNASKKKKKKKKKANSNTTEAPVSSNETTYTTTASDTVYTPTYTKVVTSDNTCVLVVNNEISSAPSKVSVNSEEKQSKVTENKVSFTVSSDKPTGDVLITRNFTPDSNIQLGNSVSIFPVLTNINTNSSNSETIISQPSLETVSNILKKEVSDSAEKENAEDSKRTKAQLKAERRAKQEAQRAAKLVKSNTKGDADPSATVQNKSTKPSTDTSKKSDVIAAENVSEKVSVKHTNVAGDKDSLRKVRLFSHLPQCRQFETNANVHPAILEVGSQYSKGIICGSNARCVALLAALREIIKDYVPPPDKNFCRELETNIQMYLSYLDNCRPLSVSMVNAVKFLKHQINHTPPEMEIDKTRERLCKFINDFINEEILLAKKAIGNAASAKIVNGDVILVYAHSSLVKDVLCKAQNENKIFRVIVADSRPKLEGLEMLRCLVKQGLHCSYISINAVSYVMKEVSKVIIGAHALLSNGCVMSRLGSKQVALVASSYSVPVLVCCETYKFCERVLTDSFVHNELGEPEDITTTNLVPNDSLKNWRDISSLQLLNLLYDVTPPDLISMVITEKGVLPCTSVPVVLRVRFAELHE